MSKTSNKVVLPDGGEGLPDEPVPFDPADVLAAEILSDALPKSVWSAVGRNEPQIFLIEVARSSWWKPMASGLRRLFTEVAVYTPTNLTSSMRDERGASVIIAPTFVVFGDPTRLPGELIAGADVRIPVRATPRALRRTLQRLYGARAAVLRATSLDSIGLSCWSL